MIMPTTTAPSSELVTLRDGHSVPLAALQVLWGLEDRQFDITLTDTGKIRVRPASALTVADRLAIRLHRETLWTLVAASCEERVT